MGPRLLLASLTGLAVAGCGGGSGEPTTKARPTAAPAETAVSAGADKPRDDAGDINALLRDRGEQLELGRTAAFAGTATGRQRALDRRAARRAKALALEHVRFRADELQTSGDRANVSVSLSYRVRGMKRPFRTLRRMLARRTGDGWRVTRDRPKAEPLPWEVDAFRAIRTPHVVLLAPPGLDPGPL